MKRRREELTGMGERGFTYLFFHFLNFLHISVYSVQVDKWEIVESRF